MTEVVITEDGIGHAKECQCGFHCYLEQLVTFYLIVNDEHHFHQWSFFHIAAGNKSNICECALNIINGNVPMNVNKLMPFEQQLKILCQPKTTDRRWRQGLSSIKGYKLFKLIRRPCICYLSAEWTLKNLYKYKLHQESSKSVRDSGRPSKIRRKVNNPCYCNGFPKTKIPRRKKRLKKWRPKRHGKTSRKRFFAQSQGSIFVKLKNPNLFSKNCKVVLTFR